MTICWSPVLPESIHFPHLTFTRPHSGPGSDRRLGLLLLPLSFGQHRDGFEFFLLQGCVECRQFFLRQFLEVVNHVLQFVTQRLSPCHLIIGWLAVIASDRSV